MKVEFDQDKNQNNVDVRGVDFSLAEIFDFTSALIVEDKRKNYGENRYSAIGYIEQRLYVLIFTPRGSILRAISLRKDNKREIGKYHEQKI